MSEFTAKEIADRLGGRVVGDLEVKLNSFTSIEKGAPGALSFLSNMAYESYLYDTKCSAVLVSEGFEPSEEVKTTLIYVSDAYAALASLLQLKEHLERPEAGISPLAFVEASAEVHPSASVGAFAYVGKGAVVGAGSVVYPQAHVGDFVNISEECIIYPQVVLYPRSIVGKRCIIHSGAVIGADGFGFAKGEEGYTKIPQTGVVVLEDDVEIGANACIDRAVLDATIIRRGAKIDDLVMVGHNAEIGAHTVMAGQSGVAGSTQIGAWNTLAGQVGVAGHLKTADGVTLAAQTGVISDIKKPNTIWFGSPAQPHMVAMKASAKMPQLPEMDRELYNLRKEVEALKKEVSELMKRGE